MLKKSLLLLSLVFSLSSWAQPYKTIKPYKPYKWMFGFHWAGIEDDGNKFGNLFDFNNAWNIQPYPTQFTLDRYLKWGWSLEGNLTYAKYNENNIVNDTTGRAGNLFSVDFYGKYSFYALYVPRLPWLDPYVAAGVGYTFRDDAGTDQHVPTVNLGAGLNLWFAPWIGMRLSGTAKLGVYPTVWDNNNNYLQYTAGILFRTPDKAKYKNPNRKKRHKWTKQRNKKYKPKKGGQ